VRRLSGSALSFRRHEKGTRRRQKELSSRLPNVSSLSSSASSSSPSESETESTASTSTSPAIRGRRRKSSAREATSTSGLFPSQNSVREFSERLEDVFAPLQARLSIYPSSKDRDLLTEVQATVGPSRPHQILQTFRHPPTDFTQGLALVSFPPPADASKTQERVLVEGTGLWGQSRITLRRMKMGALPHSQAQAPPPQPVLARANAWVDSEARSSKGVSSSYSGDMSGGFQSRGGELDLSRVLFSRDLPPQYFGEGVAAIPEKNLLFQLTWKSGLGFGYRLSDLKPLFKFPLRTTTGQGWGLIADLVEDGRKQKKTLFPAGTAPSKSVFRLRLTDGSHHIITTLLKVDDDLLDSPPLTSPETAVERETGEEAEGGQESPSAMLAGRDSSSVPSSSMTMSLWPWQSQSLSSSLPWMGGESGAEADVFGDVSRLPSMEAEAVSLTPVQDRGGFLVTRLNDLELWRNPGSVLSGLQGGRGDYFLCNIWLTNSLVLINASSGVAEAVWDFPSLPFPEETYNGEDVFNGVTVLDSQKGEFLLTGKRWARMYRTILQ